ncbi:MAG: ribonuclease HI [Neisseriaceae bacterium]|nr:ribonuclease HI [Neisseriaceae bacterium]
MENKIVSIYTDGACKGNPGRGGWGVILHYDQHEKELYGAEELTTNNRMELTAVIQGLSVLKCPCHVNIYTDSQYVQRGMSEWIHNWKKRNWKTSTNKPVANLELWQQLDKLAQIHQINWHWVRGHDGNQDNERADYLANLAIKELAKKDA